MALRSYYANNENDLSTSLSTAAAGWVGIPQWYTKAMTEHCQLSNDSISLTRDSKGNAPITLNTQ